MCARFLNSLQRVMESCDHTGNRFRITDRDRNAIHEGLLSGVVYLDERAPQTLGSEVTSDAPCYYEAKCDELFCRPSRLHRKNLVAAELDTTINYLFASVRG